MSNIQKTIAAVNQDFLAAFAGGDAHAMAATYTEDGQALPPNGDVVTGRPALEAMWQSVLDMGITGATLETVELEQHDDTADEIGRYTLSTADGTVVDNGKYVVIWQRRPDGEWRWHRDIWNSSRPAA